MCFYLLFLLELILNGTGRGGIQQPIPQQVSFILYFRRVHGVSINYCLIGVGVLRLNLSLRGRIPHLIPQHGGIPKSSGLSRGIPQPFPQWRHVYLSKNGLQNFCPMPFLSFLAGVPYRYLWLVYPCPPPTGVN